MDDFFTPVSTTYLKSINNASSATAVSAVPATNVKPGATLPAEITSPKDALEILKRQPDHDQLAAVLRFLEQETDGFSIVRPDPRSAQVVQALVGEVAPNYWVLLKEGSLGEDPGEGREGGEHGDLHRFLECLRSLTGLNSLLWHLRMGVRDAANAGSGPARPDVTTKLALYLDILCSLIQPDDAFLKLWTGSVKPLDEPVRKQLFREIVSLVAGGKVVSVAAEAEASLASRAGDGAKGRKRWVADGAAYSAWLGRNIAAWARQQGEQGDDLAQCGTLWARGVGLGYADKLVGAVVDAVLLSPSATPGLFPALLNKLPLDQKKVLNSLVGDLSGRFLSSLSPTDVSPNAAVSGVAALLRRVVAGDKARSDILLAWLTGSAGAGLGEGIAIRRAVIAVMGEKKDDILRVAEGALGLWGDELYIKHSPMLQQEAHAQVLLLAIGYLHHLAPLKLVSLVRSRDYLNTISNRIGSTQARTRFLGMAVGEALSLMVDSKSKRLEFGVEEMDSEEAVWWKGLVNVRDSVGDATELQSEVVGRSVLETPSAPAKQTFARVKPAQGTETAATASRPKRIIEVIDSDGQEARDGNFGDDDDLEPYPKPDHDPQDPDDDPTVIHRSRSKPPVYIRTLLTYLRGTEDPDMISLALTYGPRLIRRKAAHGTEVSAHATELASQFASLGDKFELPEFEHRRSRGLVALVVACPDAIAPWLAKTFWEADMTLSQRAGVLAALGIGALEIAGLETGEEDLDGDGFVGRRLPERLERLYLESQPHAASPGSSLKPMPRNAIDTAAQELASSFLAPIVAAAADATTGPDALKLSTFKSRLPASSSQKKKPRPKVRAIPNTTASLLYVSFFSPLAARLSRALAAPSAMIRHDPYLLALYVKTLGLIAHAAGPSTLALPQLTAELWGLLLRVRAQCVGEPGLAHAVLSALAALLDVNDASAGGLRRLCEECGRELVETRDWVAGVFASIRGEGRGEETGVKVLAAGLLVRLDEMLEKYKALLMGVMI